MLRTVSMVIAAIAAVIAVAAQAQIEPSKEQKAEIAARIAPACSVCVQGESCGGMPAGAAGAGGAGDTVAAVDGEGTYNSACMACHMTGAGGAPVVGNVDAWAPRIAKGTDALHSSGLNGVAGTTMLAKGGRADLSDQEVIDAVAYMVEQSQ